MHPILSNVRRLGWYLLCWFPIGTLLFVLMMHGGMARPAAAVLTSLLCAAYAFVCLSAWYSCRAIPLETSGLLRPLASHGLAGFLLSGLWVLVARWLAVALSSFPRFRGAGEQMSRNVPLLFASGTLLYLLSVALHYILLTLQASREAEQRMMEARVLARDAELKALKAQVNPHFIFNSLHSISALTSIDGTRAREMCIALADFLRLTLALGSKETISLQDEISLLHSYLAVEKIRFGARLALEEEIQDETLACQLPPLLLQPLIENAVTHGIANLPEGGRIRLKISSEEEAKSVHVRIQNSYDPEAPPRRKNGVGMANVKQRMNARYGDQASFQFRREDQTFEVDLLFPAERKGNA